MKIIRVNKSGRGRAVPLAEGKPAIHDAPPTNKVRLFVAGPDRHQFVVLVTPLEILAMLRQLPVTLALDAFGSSEAAGKWLAGFKRYEAAARGAASVQAGPVVLEGDDGSALEITDDAISWIPPGESA